MKVWAVKVLETLNTLIHMLIFGRVQKIKHVLHYFFAQVSNDDDSEHHWSFCQPVSNLSTNGKLSLHWIHLNIRAIFKR